MYMYIHTCVRTPGESTSHVEVSSKAPVFPPQSVAMGAAASVEQVDPWPHRIFLQDFHRFLIWNRGPVTESQ